MMKPYELAALAIPHLERGSAAAARVTPFVRSIVIEPLRRRSQGVLNKSWQSCCLPATEVAAGPACVDMSHIHGVVAVLFSTGGFFVSWWKW